ncbi:TetR family transcriptional regulator [Flavitalea sp. BT771]|uniref:TetR/AcrR family transcriptional regulator n=1 Tax=Flavitalea sp. BT771 TaxID=3063329 RepID=UPI0026E241D1|nr:TetR family transcriptional regulator [Flavitalea sp. BT771]MDO6434346.1 TetR family transcriptional regulator [Flavitalea sp. BT771]MDV6223246.1 TetR family transcriptional regulator [Flavitalea sp. BT771]
MAADKREHILTVAEELFGDNGFDGTSVRDIAQKAGVNLAMISYYFGSKEKLLEALIELRAGYSFGILEELNKDETLSPWDKIDRLVEFYVEKVLNNLRFHSIMYREATNVRSEEIRDRIINIKLRNLEQITKIIQDGQQKKLFREIDIPMTMGSLMGTISSYTQARPYGCQVLALGYDANDEAYRSKLAPRLKAHLKQLLRAHLDIANLGSPSKG